MVIIHLFQENSREDGLIYIISEEVHRCPKCEGQLKTKDYRERQGWTKYGEKRHYLLRRLQCKECGAIQIELPYFLMPYKRYNAEAIECVLHGEDLDCVASIRTKKRSVTDEVYARMNSDQANKILASFDFDDDPSGKHPDPEIESNANSDSMNDMMMKLFTAMDPDMLIRAGKFMKSMKTNL